MRLFGLDGLARGRDEMLTDHCCRREKKWDAVQLAVTVIAKTSRIQSRGTIAVSLTPRYVAALSAR